jgi:hypothetical protein
MELCQEGASGIKDSLTDLSAVQAVRIVQAVQVVSAADAARFELLDRFERFEPAVELRAQLLKESLFLDFVEQRMIDELFRVAVL